MAHSTIFSSVMLGDLFPTINLSAELNNNSIVTLEVGQLCLDSRTVQVGDTFVALVGGQLDGRAYIGEAIAAGATLVLCSSAESNFSLDFKGSVPVLQVPNLNDCLNEIAGIYYCHPANKMDLVAITGTNGKTTCSQWLAQLLSLLGRPAATIGTLGYGLESQPLIETGMTTPDAITSQKILAEMREAGAHSVVAEVSSHSLALNRVNAVPFRVAAVTNIGRDHLDYHGSLEEYVEAKKKLLSFASVESVVLNLDDEFYSEFKMAGGSKTQITISLKSEQADFYAENICYQPQGISFTLVSPQGRFQLELPIWGEFNVYNILTVVAVAVSLGLTVQECVSKLPKMKSVAGRLEQVEAAQDLTVIVDFAHTPDALKSVLCGIKLHAANRLWCVFGCGGDRDLGKRPLMADVAERFADCIVVTSDNPRSETPESIMRDISSGFKNADGITFIVDRAQAIGYAIENAQANDLILIAGKGHENFQIVGANKFPFSDVACARLALRKRQEAVQ
jgi:UDP-N-acetylmuramoyl-L-alanyl-D-glutamate--2,6-diaminopimelate ligase